MKYFELANHQSVFCFPIIRNYVLLPFPEIFEYKIDISFHFEFTRCRQFYYEYQVFKGKEYQERLFKVA